MSYVLIFPTSKCHLNKLDKCVSLPGLGRVLHTTVKYTDLAQVQLFTYKE